MITTINEYKLVLENWYHGSDYNFDSFAEYKSKGPSALGIFVTDDKSLAELFGENVYDVNITYNNPYKISMDKWDSIRENHARDTEYFIAWRKELMSQGYDSIFIKERTIHLTNYTLRDGNIVILFKPEQLKINTVNK